MKRRGFTLVEVMMGVGLTALLIVMALNVFTDAAASFHRTETRDTLSTQNALAVRRIVEQLRSAAVVEIRDSGRTIVFEQPMLSANPDPTTGEYEYVDPMLGDGVQQAIYYQDRKLIFDDGSGREVVLADEVSATDPDPDSAYYNTAYPIFSNSSVGSTRGVRIMIVSSRMTHRGLEYSRMSTTVLLRNLL
ncbi:MAG: prepilin-type N-terminal cleavage/methylation domain-containing protein [Armatimonadota bacterium]